MLEPTKNPHKNNGGSGPDHPITWILEKVITPLWVKHPYLTTLAIFVVLFFVGFGATYWYSPEFRKWIWPDPPPPPVATPPVATQWYGYMSNIDSDGKHYL